MKTKKQIIYTVVKFNFTTVFSTILLILIFTPVKTYAANISLGVYPPLIKIKTSPNNHIQQILTISNYSDSPTITSISLKAFKASDEKNGQITFLPNDTRTKNFFSEAVKITDDGVPVNQVLLAPKQQKPLIVELTIPKNQAETDYYFSILFIAKNTQQTKSNASIISGGIASNVLLSILPQPQQDTGFIKQFSGSTFIDKDLTSFTVEIGNQGKHFTTTEGSITITNMLWGSKNVIKLQKATILGSTSRFLSNKDNASKALWTHGLLFGVYKADLSVKEAYNNTIYHQSYYFYSYPAVGFGIAAIVIIFSGIITFKISRKHS